MIGIRSYLWNDYRNYWHERWAKKQPPARCKTCRNSRCFGHRIWMGGARLPHRHSVLQLWSVHQVKLKVFKTYALGPRKSRTLIFRNVLAMRRKKFKKSKFITGAILICIFGGFYLFSSKPEAVKKIVKKTINYTKLKVSGSYRNPKL